MDAILKLFEQVRIVDQWNHTLGDAHKWASEGEYVDACRRMERAERRERSAAEAAGGAWLKFYNFCECNDARFEKELEAAVKLYLKFVAHRAQCDAAAGLAPRDEIPF
jgi:hypothetical protein